MQGIISRAATTLDPQPRFPPPHPPWRPHRQGVCMDHLPQPRIGRRVMRAIEADMRLNGVCCPR